jgi:hypothetical protein
MSVNNQQVNLVSCFSFPHSAYQFMCACIKPDSIFVTVVLQKDLENLLLKLDLNPKGLAPILDELGVENVKV